YDWANCKHWNCCAELRSESIREAVVLQVSLASEFMYNHMTRDVTSSFGYDYILRQIDHSKKDYKFGFGMTVGE
ncbi:hypothetical protein B296_00012028, partial [Ensete ventricosum]